MRAGICNLQQALTAEAASIVKQAVTLARRRGHAQVTPLHVASSMLASSNGLLRRACLQSHSHPLQCKALELCFNVALNRLPTSTSSALLGPHSSFPSLSNALVAAVKRAQAHQRRGSIENQQQPILALKIEIEQLIISILDDPSVSRVMREAGFSSTQVKYRVDEAISLEICSQNASQSKEITKHQTYSTNNMCRSLSFNHYGVTQSRSLDYEVTNSDITSVLKNLVEKKRNTVITGEYVEITESVFRGVKDKIERGLAPEEMRSARFISFPLISLRDLTKEEIEQKLVELRCIVKSYINRGVVLYLGDLKWVSELWSSYAEQRRSYYCSAEHIIMELKRIVRKVDQIERLWLVGIATLQTYMKCKAGHPSLETVWDLSPITVPVGSLSLTLSLDSDLQRHHTSKQSMYCNSWPVLESAVDNHYTDFAINLNKDTQSIGCSTQKDFTTSSNLPSWLKQHKEETQRFAIDDKEYCTRPLLKKWNSFNEESQYPHKTIKFASSPPSPISISSHERNTNLNEAHLSWPAILEQRKFHIEDSESNLISVVAKPELLSNPNSSPNSASSSEAIDGSDGLQSFKELSDQNLKILCSCLEKKVPWQKDIVPEIANTVLKCRSGMRESKCKSKIEVEREEVWLFFLGDDCEGKEKIARELARLVFGSQACFVSIGLKDIRSDSSTVESKNRRKYDLGGCYYERLGLALNENPHRVFFMEHMDQVDYSSTKEIKKAIESGTVTLSGGENVPLKDAIVIFSSESSVRKASSTSKQLKTEESQVAEDKSNEKNTVISLDLNIAIDVDDGDGHNSNISESGLILQYVDKKIMFKNKEL